MKVAPAQRAALQRAVDNGGTIEVGGVDGDPVRPDVARRLYALGLLRYAPGGLVGGQPWIITDAGRAALTNCK